MSRGTWWKANGPCLRTSFRRKTRKNEHPLGCGVEEDASEKRPADGGASGLA